MSYQLIYETTVWKTLQSLPESTREKLFAGMEALEWQPRPAGCKKLAGSNAYRIRVGDFRVLYEIRDAVLIVIVVEVSRRDKAYKDKR